jgi:hypothetical protein
MPRPSGLLASFNIFGILSPTEDCIGSCHLRYVPSSRIWGIPHEKKKSKCHPYYAVKSGRPWGEFAVQDEKASKVFKLVLSREKFFQFFCFPLQ